MGAEPSLVGEVEDIAALIAAVGQPASLFGISSGGALVIEAVLAGLPVDKVAVYEVPYAVTAEREQQSRDYFSELSRTLAENRRGDAARLFMRTAGVPEDMIAGMEHSPYWSGMQAIAPTLVHDALAMHFSTGGRIPEALARLSNKALVAVGSGSPPMLTEPGRALAALLPNATFQLLPGETHNVSVDAIEAVLRRFLLA
jgi:pimeloyl-ACP methyl ester carboxylesterase